MEISFTPTSDVAAVLNALLDRLENRQRRSSHNPTGSPPLAARAVKVRLAELELPGYFSQTDPEPRLSANRQFLELSVGECLSLAWLPGESGHLLEAVTLKEKEALYALLGREPLAQRQIRLEEQLLAERFRFPAEDWRSIAVGYALAQVRAGKSPAPFRLNDPDWNADLLVLLAALPALQIETPYRVFSVRIFNNSKRFEVLMPALVRLARLGRPQWRRLRRDELLRELNLVANPTYLNFSGNWLLTSEYGEILSLGGFTPSLGFPAAQAASIQAVTVQAAGVLCIENLTTFHEFTRQANQGSSACAAVCLLGNPAPPLRRMLHLLPAETPLYLWADLDYGGFNILSQMRQLVHPRVQPYRMDIPTFEAFAGLARPLTRSDGSNLKRLSLRPELQDVCEVIQHLLQRGLKLEQEAIDLR